jgi:2-oxo-3-hexenedioate decarboxylase
MNPSAANLLASYDRGQQIALLSAADPAFQIADAYRLAGELVALRQQRGERLAGRKIGFTNRRLSPRLGVSAPIWGAVWNTTLELLQGDSATLSLAGMMQPKLEPEIVFGLRKAPNSAAFADVLDAIAWVAHGFEIVQTPYPDWKFTAADGIAGFGLHARLIVGPRVPTAELGADLAAQLAGLSVELCCDDRMVSSGRGADVLDGPVQSLALFVSMLAGQPELPQLSAGEVITTGTLTDAQPLAAGQHWHTRIAGVSLSGLRLAVT